MKKLQGKKVQERSLIKWFWTVTNTPLRKLFRDIFLSSFTLKDAETKQSEFKIDLIWQVTFIRKIKKLSLKTRVNFRGEGIGFIMHLIVEHLIITWPRRINLQPTNNTESGRHCRGALSRNENSPAQKKATNMTTNWNTNVKLNDW